MLSPRMRQPCSPRHRGPPARGASLVMLVPHRVTVNASERAMTSG
jgi:hypothetical protein